MISKCGHNAAGKTVLNRWRATILRRFEVHVETPYQNACVARVTLMCHKSLFGVLSEIISPDAVRKIQSL